MAYRALYQEDRPFRFADVVGQEMVVKTLARQIETGRIFHAYLFAGPRGIGKTTVARILARTVNCRRPADGEACGECDFCRSVNSEGAMDIIEIDGASNNRVDEIRELRDNVGYLPAVGKYRVYIVDEVHMLSNSAFNALLKTLEEPPEHIIFIFATTEPHKLPDTVLSRCQRYDFKRMTMLQMTGRMESILSRKERKAQPAALAMIARQAGGAMRDAVSMLDQCLTISEGDITTDTVTRVLGVTDAAAREKLEDSILAGDAAAAVTLSRALLEKGADPSAMGQEMLRGFGDLFLAHFQPALAEELTGDAALAAALRRRASAASPRQITRITRLLSQLEGDLRFASQPSLLLGTTLARCAQLPQEEDMTAVLERLERLEKGLTPAPDARNAAPEVETEYPEPVSDSAPPPEEAPLEGDDEEPLSAPSTEEQAKPRDPGALRRVLRPKKENTSSVPPVAGQAALWTELIRRLDEKGKQMYTAPMRRCKPEALEGMLLRVTVPPPDDGTLSRMKRYTVALEEELAGMTGKPMKLEFQQMEMTPQEREFVEESLRALPDDIPIDICDKVD